MGWGRPAAGFWAALFLIFCVSSASATRLASGTFKSCGRYHVAGELDCVTAAKCRLLLNPRTLSELQLVLEQAPPTYLLREAAVVEFEVSIESLAGQPLSAVPLSRFPRYLKNFRASGLPQPKLVKEAGCR